MSPLILTLKKRPVTRVDLSSLTPDRLNGLNVNAIKALKLDYSGQQIAITELFDVTGDDTDSIHFRRSSRAFTKIGYGMTKGSIEVRGHAGDYLGQKMSGGRINARGEAGNWLANKMSGGRIDISGNVADFAGAALPDETQGMSDGIVTIRGNAGDRIGDRMRRGLIIVLGNAGDFTGSRMIAGTIIILGKSGHQTGYGMKRGTIILGKKPQKLLATFNSCGKLKMEFLRVFYKQIANIGRRFAHFKDFGPEVYRYAGDSSAGGKGEILIMLHAT